MSDCIELVDRGHGRWSNMQPCGRPAVQDGLCKLHSTVKARRKKKDREFAEEMKRNDQLKAEATRLGKRLGIHVTADYSMFTRKHTGDFVVPGDWLREVAKGKKAK